MSRCLAAVWITDTRFPRSRGDEPYENYFTVYDGMFSPLTRG